jgi:hypothetical protein
VDDVITAARAASSACRWSSGVVGTIDLAVDDPRLECG